MKKTISRPLVLVSAAALLALLAFLVWGLPYFFQAPVLEGVNTTLGEATYRARVEAILSSSPIDLGGSQQTYQRVRIKILEGDYAGLPMEVDYGNTRLMPNQKLLQAGEQIFVLIGKRPDGVIEAHFVDFVREKALLTLFAIFVGAILFMGRWKGLRSLAALGFSLVMIIWYVIPHILSGEDPVRVSLIGSAILLGSTLYLTYGWNWKTHASVIGMVLALFITGMLAWVFMDVARLSGAGSEETLFLIQSSQMDINLRGLLLGSIIIGALGVLDDLVTSQSAVVFELHHTDESLGYKTIFEKAMRVGQDHVAATVNTLVLAYAGGALPLLLLFTLGHGNYGFFINVEYVTEEIVRTLVGSLGLITAVPLTTAIATLIALYGHRLPADWRALLGSETGGGSHTH